MQRSWQSDPIPWGNNRRISAGHRLWHGLMHAEEMVIRGGNLGEQQKEGCQPGEMAWENACRRVGDQRW